MHTYAHPKTKCWQQQAVNLSFNTVSLSPESQSSSDSSHNLGRPEKQKQNAAHSLSDWTTVQTLVVETFARTPHSGLKEGNDEGLAGQSLRVVRYSEKELSYSSTPSLIREGCNTSLLSSRTRNVDWWLTWYAVFRLLGFICVHTNTRPLHLNN